jgi:tetratricopeptide (TPR) repeat protein
MIRPARRFAMALRKLKLAAAVCALAGLATARAQNDDALVHRHWYESRTAHFNIYSCGSAQEVAKIGARLEQFRDAFGLLAGAQSVVSPPITVMAFPDVDAMQPYLPLYNGKPANLEGFFKRSADENIIVLALTGTNSISLDTIYHEYTHMLFRHNARFWPVWLNEGMAEIYSTFESTGRGVRIAKPIAHHLRELEHSGLMPVQELLTVTHESPQYNEADRQGVFYAESWLLTHFLMSGDNAAFKARFKNYTALLIKGLPPDTALASALGVPLTTLDSELRRYLERGQFESIAYVVPVDLSAPRAMTTRPIGQSETCFRLGNELMRIDRLDSAEPYFAEAQTLSPTSPLAFEGLGLLAAEREKTGDAVRLLKASLERGSASYLAHYVYAEQRLRLTADAQERYHHVADDVAGEVRAELTRSIGLMPNFGPSHEMLGFFELVQGQDYAGAEQQLQRAIQLEPERQGYMIYLAEAQLMLKDNAGARQTLESLLQSHAEAKLRDRAKEVLAEMDREAAGGR